MPINVVLYLILITVFWGYAWVLMKIALEYMGPFTFAFFRFAVGSLTMFIIVFLRKIPMPRRGDWIYLAFLGFFQTTSTFLLLMYGMLFVSAGKSAVLLYTMPIWSMILASFYLNEKVTKRKIGSLILGISGLLLILGWDVLSSQNMTIFFGECLIILGAFAWSVANILIKKRFANHNKLLISTWQMSFGTIGILLAALIMEWGRPVQFTQMSVLAIVFCGVFASAFCFTVWYIILSKIDTTVASVSLLFVPVLALFFSWLQLNEEINLSIIVGTLLISSGVYLSTVQKKNNKVYKAKH